MPRFHKIDGVRTQFTAEEETARDADEAASEAKLTAIDAVITASTAAKARAVAKLVALGLTEEETQTLF